MSDVDANAETKNKIGRPSKYTPEMCELFTRELAKGFSKEAVCGIADIHRGTMYEWMEAHPEFSNAIKQGESKSILYFEKLMLLKGSGAKVKGFDPRLSDMSAIIFPLKTRFHKVYGEKVEVKTEHKPISITYTRKENIDEQS